MPPTAPNVTIKPPAGSAIEAVPPVENVPLENVRERVQSVINLIRPAVQADGGDIELVNVTSAGVVQIRFHGACHGCPSSTMTLHMGIERNIREKVPEITQVVSVP
jgi:Fe-S cluster biogenesis protein NfuA